MTLRLQKLLERAKHRQKQLEEYLSEAGEISKRPLLEANQLISKIESNALLIKSQPNLNCESTKIAKKQISSDPCINKKTLYSKFKENLSDTSLNKNSRSTLITSECSPKTPTKTLNIQQESFNMEIKVTSLDNIRVEVEVQEEDDSEEDSDVELQDTDVSGIKKIVEKKRENVEDHAPIRADSKKRLDRLGKLYSSGK